jgi:hypothetical protein
LVALHICINVKSYQLKGKFSFGKGRENHSLLINENI